ncbi:MAG: hypothetical protein NZ516_11910 [Raineya sp.]|nr:hypothetical protein [Raineya sp.]
MTKTQIKTTSLHIEFQVEDSEEMIYRMAEYYAILLRKYRLEVHQYVFYIAKTNPKMTTKISCKNFDFGFTLINLQDYSHEIFLNSDIPEEVILESKRFCSKN